MFHLKSANKEDAFLHFRIRTYHGDKVIMTGGTELVSGDRVMELHFDNKKLFEISSRSRTPVQLAIKMIRKMDSALPELASYVVNHPELHDVKALYGVSMINRGPEQFGFTVTDLPKGWFASSSRIYLKLLMSVIHPEGSSRLKENAEELVPKLIVMPIEYLVTHYSEDGSHHRLMKKEQIEEDETVLSSTLPCP